MTSRLFLLVIVAGSVNAITRPSPVLTRAVISRLARVPTSSFLIAELEQADATPPPSPVQDVLLSVPLYTAINIAMMYGLFLLPFPSSRVLGFGFIAFFSSWAHGLVDTRSMIIAVARGQIVEPEAELNKDWLTSLRVPSWAPPGFLLPDHVTTVDEKWLLFSKPTQVAACVTLADAMGPSFSAVCWPMLLWITHLSLGDAWNEVFFYRQRVGAGAAIVGAFYVTLLATAIAFARFSRRAGLLMMPTFAWVTIATSLNLSIWWLNRDSQ